MDWKRLNLTRSTTLARLRDAVWQLRSQPRWVWMGASGTALLVVLMPLISLLVTTICVFAVTFLLLVLGRRIATVLPSLWVERPPERTTRSGTDPKVEILWPPYP